MIFSIRFFLQFENLLARWTSSPLNFTCPTWESACPGCGAMLIKCLPLQLQCMDLIHYLMTNLLILIYVYDMHPNQNIKINIPRDFLNVCPEVWQWITQNKLTPLAIMYMLWIHACTLNIIYTCIYCCKVIYKKITKILSDVIEIGYWEGGGT
jgi:hypothetical protein